IPEVTAAVAALRAAQTAPAVITQLAARVSQCRVVWFRTLTACTTRSVTVHVQATTKMLERKHRRSESMNNKIKTIILLFLLFISYSAELKAQTPLVCGELPQVVGDFLTP